MTPAAFDSQPMPGDKMIERLCEARFSDDAKEKAAFGPPGGHWQCTEVLPFRLHEAPASFQRLNDIVLRATGNNDGLSRVFPHRPVCAIFTQNPFFSRQIWREWWAYGIYVSVALGNRDSPDIQQSLALTLPHTDWFPTNPDFLLHNNPTPFFVPHKCQRNPYRLYGSKNNRPN